MRCVVAAAALLLAAASAVLGVLLYLSLGEAGAPSVLGMLLFLVFGGVAAVLTLLGVRFVIVAVTTSRAAVEITDAGLRVTGGLRPRLVPWHEILAVESQVVHPVHWLTAALRLRDGSRVIMPAFDRHIWNYSQPSGQDIRALRGELRRREQAAADASPLPRCPSSRPILPRPTGRRPTVQTGVRRRGPGSCPAPTGPGRRRRRPRGRSPRRSAPPRRPAADVQRARSRRPRRGTSAASCPAGRRRRCGAARPSAPCPRRGRP